MKLLVLFTLIFISVQSIAQTSIKNTDSIPNIPDHGIVFSRVEVEAEFPGGLDGWRNYLMENLNPNVPVRKKAPAGNYTVVIRFIVAKDGSITDIQPETAMGYGMENEVMRIIKKAPNGNQRFKMAGM